MIMLAITVIALFAVSATARQFNNPLTNNLVFNPSPVKYKGTYYMIDEYTVNSDMTFPILVSTDLQNWKSNSVQIIGADDVNYVVMNGIDLQVLGDGQFRIYYTVRGAKNYTINVAFATDILGPYYFSSAPALRSQSFIDHPTVFNSSGVLYMAWVEYNQIVGQRMRPDGFGVADEPSQVLLSYDLDWEAGAVDSPFIIQRGDYFYLFYSAVIHCEDQNGIGVARSLFPLGPYEKLGNQILVNDLKFRAPHYPQIVKDVDDKTDVIVHSCLLSADPCNSGTWAYPCAKALTWTKDDWPALDNSP